VPNHELSVQAAHLYETCLLDLLAACECEEEQQATLHFDLPFLPGHLARAAQLLVVSEPIKLAEAWEIPGADGIETLLALG
jgi:hypothetical protein